MLNLGMSSYLKRKWPSFYLLLKRCSVVETASPHQRYWLWASVEEQISCSALVTHTTEKMFYKSPLGIRGGSYNCFLKSGAPQGKK